MTSDNIYKSTIMFTDIVGYSAMVDKDQNHAMELLSMHDKIIEPIIKENNGRIIKKIGISQSDSDVVQLKHLLLGRASQFIEYSSKSDHPQAEDALWAIKEGFDVRWSKKSFVAPIVYYIWGWLQLELGKEGEKQMPRTQRHERQLSE